MRLAPAIVLGLWSTLAPSLLDAQTHPRIWLTPSFLASIKAKAAAGNADWRQVKSSADQLLSRAMPRFTIVAATNANPVQFTLAESVPFESSTPIFIGGGSGAWSAVNATGGDRPSSMRATRTGSHTFTVPIDSSALGSFDGQHLVVFFSEGGLSGYGYQGSDWQSSLQTLGLAYQVTGNAAYAAKGIELLDYIASLGNAGMLAPEAIDSGFPSRSAIFGVALGYDWLYDRLSPDQRAAIIRAINLWYDWFKRAAFENGGPAYGNYFGGHVLGFGVAGFATESDNPRGAEIVAHIRSLFDTYVTTAFTSGGFAGGYPVEAYTYGANHFQRLLYYMLAVQSATGDDLVARIEAGQKIARSLLYNLKPNRWQVTDEGDYAGDFTGVLQPNLPIVLSDVLAGTQEGAWMQFLVQHLAPAPDGGRTTDAFVQCLFYDSSRQAVDYRTTQPTWYRSAGDEHVYWRSSWRDDAVWVSIAAGTRNWASHQGRTAGHVSIQRGNDYLLVNSGQWKGESGVTGNPQAFDNRGWRANTLFVNDGGDYLFTGANYLGGQGFWGTNQVLAQEGRGEFAYVKTDLTSAYTVGDRKPFDDRSVRVFQRNFLSLGSGIVVLFDRTQFRKESYVKKLYFHLNPAGVPAVSGQTVTSRVGNSVLFIKTLLPAQPRIEIAQDPVSDTDPRPITTRVEVSDAVSGASFNALNVLIAAPSSTTTMPRAEGIQSEQGRMTGVIVDDGTAKRIALFSNDATAQAGVVYAADYQAGTTGTHVVADLVPGAAYDITLNGTALQTVTSSPQGVAAFQSNGGGRFELARRSGSPPPASPGPKAPANLRVLSEQPSAPTTPSTPTAPAPVPTAPTSNANPDHAGARFVAMVSPVAGETFTAPASVRLIAAGKDPNVYINSPRDGLGGNAARVRFFIDDAVVLEVDGSNAEYYVFKGFAANVAAGPHRVWARAFYENPALVLDSLPVTIRVDAAPAYSRTVDLGADLTIAGSAFALSGTPGGRVRVNGNGHRIVGSGGTQVRFEHVDFFDLGDRTSTQLPGIDVATRGSLVIDDCRFDDSNPVQLTIDGSAAATIVRNTFRSNMRQPLGQSPDGNGHGSFPVVVLKGSSTGPKVFQGNNVGAGWVLLQGTRAWLVGGEAAAESNVLIGPRVGIFVDRSTDIMIRRNYSHHVYYGGWSQGSNFELGGVATVTAEHNVIAGSSWPVRGVAGEFRYNLVADAGHEWLWADHDDAHVHHNLFVGGDNDVGGIYVLYAPKNVRLENNTFDGLGGRQLSTATKLTDGTVSLTSNLFVNVPRTAVTVGTSALAADYNLFWNSAPPAYSDGRTPPHDMRSDPLLSAPPTVAIDVDEALVWTRALAVPEILARYRARYAPKSGSPAIDAGDPAAGAGNDIGAIGGGAAHPLDQFGR